ncbi:MAG: hypothetical protein AAB611_00300 [Patescibacteria group bacterium]
MDMVTNNNKTVLLKSDVSDTVQKLREEVEMLRDKKSNLSKFPVLGEQVSVRKAHLKEVDKKLRYKEKCLKASERYDPCIPPSGWIAGFISVALRHSFAVIRLRAWACFTLATLNLIFDCTTSPTDVTLYGFLSTIVLIVSLVRAIYVSACPGYVLYSSIKKSGSPGWADLEYETFFYPRIYKQLLPPRIAGRYVSAKKLRVFDEILVFSPVESVFKEIVREDMEVVLVGRVRGDGDEESFFRIGSWRLREEELKHVV